MRDHRHDFANIYCMLPFAAFIATPIGCGSDYGLVAPAKYWQEVRRICDENNVLLIADEVVTGFGRRRWLTGMTSPRRTPARSAARRADSSSVES